MLPAIAFLLGQGTDQSGRTLADYRAFDAAKWEDCHDHMQWAFPTRTRSAYNRSAPTIPNTFKFDGNDAIKTNITDLLKQYLASLGVRMHFYPENGWVIEWEPGTPNPYWVYSQDHNTLRMTRVLECLGIFGLKNLQTALFEFLVYSVATQFSPRINGKTVAFWVAAKENRLDYLR